MTDDDKRALLAEREKALNEFWACPPTNTVREFELGQRFTAIDRRCREVFGPVVPRSI